MAAEPPPGASPSRPKRGPAGWADAVRAAAVLGLRTPEELTDLMESLGLRDAPESPPPAAPFDPPRPTSSETAPVLPTLPADPQPPSGLAQEHRVTATTPLDQLPGDAAWLEVPPVHDLDPEPTLRYVPPAPAAVLRAALTVLLQRRRPSDRIDIRATMAQAARLEPLTDPPREVERTTGAGATVLADLRTAMIPQLDDIRQLVQAVSAAVGRPRVHVHWLLDGDPLPPLPAGRPLLVVSALWSIRGTARTVIEDLWPADRPRHDDPPTEVVLLVPTRRPGVTTSARAHARVVAWHELQEVGRGRYR